MVSTCRRLFFFSELFPYGIGELWKLSEIQELSTYFDRITIVPLRKGNEPSRLELPRSVVCEDPLLRDGPRPSLLSTIGAPECVREAWRARIWRNRRRLGSWLSASRILMRVQNDPRVRGMLQEDQRRTVFYFYWGNEATYLVPRLAKAARKTVVRFHRWDLYDNGGHRPFRRSVLENVDHALFVSQHGLDYMKTTYPTVGFDARLFRLGVRKRGCAKESSDGVLRLVSCSLLRSVKRVHVIVEALMLMKRRVDWVHLGDGEERRRIENVMRDLPPNVCGRLMGQLESNKVLEFYDGRQIDLFVNASESEGVPVSIMEALSAEIPIVATNVGGTGEIVDGAVGLLLPAGCNAELLALHIEKYAGLGPERKRTMRRECGVRFAMLCDGKRNSRAVAEFIGGLVL